MEEAVRYTVLVHPDLEAGGFYATVPAIPGVVDQGETEEEALRNIQEALTFTLESMLEEGEELPPDTPVADVSTVDIEHTPAR